jgi:ATP-binding protein involved in chromosome partitioning
MKIFCDPGNGSAAASHLDKHAASEPLKLINPRMSVAFGSVRGGCGKSTLVVNIAGALALAGIKVGIFDADLNSPSIPAMLGIKPFRMLPAIGGIDPASGPLGLRVIAASLIPHGEPPLISFAGNEPEPAAPAAADLALFGYSAMLAHMAANARFGNIDIVLIDLATGVEHIHRISRHVSLDGVVLVSTPAGAAMQATRHAATAIPGAAPAIGIIENMAGFNCDNCHSIRPLFPIGGAATSGPPLLGRLPFDPRIAECAERGTLFVKDYPDTLAAKTIVEIARRIEAATASHVRGEMLAAGGVEPK